MHVDPADPAPMEFPRLYERHDLEMRNDRRLLYQRVACQERLPATLVADEQFTAQQVVANGFVATEQPVQVGRVWGAIRQKPDPDGRVDEDAHATERRDSCSGCQDPGRHRPRRQDGLRSVVERSGAIIDVEDDGRIAIASADETAAQTAISIIQELPATPELHKTYMGTV